MTRRLIVALVAGALLASCLAASASASASTMTVNQAIKAQDKAVHNNATFKSLKNFKIDTVAEAQKAVPKFVALQKLIANAATAVSKASASTSDQKLGQKDWVSGARDVSHAVGYVVTELNDLIKSNKAGAEAAAKKSLALQKAGDALGIKADKLLGLPSSD